VVGLGYIDNFVRPTPLGQHAVGAYRIILKCL